MPVTACFSAHCCSSVRLYRPDMSLCLDVPRLSKALWHRATSIHYCSNSKAAAVLTEIQLRAPLAICVGALTSFRSCLHARKHIVACLTCVRFCGLCNSGSQHRRLR